MWSSYDLESAVSVGDVVLVKHCLERVCHSLCMGQWDDCMEMAISRRRPDLMRLLFENGFQDGEMWLIGVDHPVGLSIMAGTLEGAHVAVKYCGVPAAECMETLVAALGGEDLLRYTRRLCGSLHDGKAEAAAFPGGVKALQYAHESGALRDRATFLAAIEGDHLDCLRYTNEHGCPHNVLGEPSAVVSRWSSCLRNMYDVDLERVLIRDICWNLRTYIFSLISSQGEHVFTAAKSLPMLCYACDHMGSAWREGVPQPLCLLLDQRCPCQ